MLPYSQKRLLGMPKRFSSREIIAILEKNGFIYVSQKGSHIKFFCEQSKATVIIPANRGEIPVGTLHSIIRQSKIKKEFFEK